MNIYIYTHVCTYVYTLWVTDLKGTPHNAHRRDLLLIEGKIGPFLNGQWELANIFVHGVYVPCGNLT